MLQTRRKFIQTAAFLAGCLLGTRSAAAQTDLAPTHDHERWMRRALECGARNPHAPFGAVVVDRQAGREVAWGVNHTVDGPMWHGEMDALDACPIREQGFDWKRLALYTTAEPCPMCQSTIVWAGIPLVVYGTSMTALTAMGWDQIDLPAKEVVSKAPFSNCRVVGGILSAECDETFRRALILRQG